MVHEKKNMPKEGWRQVDFKHFICIPNFKCFLIVLPLICFISFILTIIILSYTYQIKEVISGEFRIQNRDEITVNIDKDLDEPVYLYIYFLDFYQNHRIYLKSKSKSQLADKSDNSLSDSCSPLYKNGDLDTDFKIGVEDKKILNPCGMLPRSFLNLEISAKLNTNKTLTLSTKDISWETDNDSKYKKSTDFDVEDEKFKNWMRTGATRYPRKLYYKIKNDLNDGDELTFSYTLMNKDEIYYTYRPKFKIILSTTTRIGGKNKVLGFVFLVITIISFIWSVLFAFLEYNSACKRKLAEFQKSK